MIVERRTFKAKLGRELDLVALGKEECDKLRVSYRTFTSMVGGAAGRVIFEFAFENEAAREKFWADWNARPETPAWAERFYQLIDNDASYELLRVY